MPGYTLAFLLRNVRARDDNRHGLRMLADQLSSFFIEASITSEVTDAQVEQVVETPD